MNDFKVPDLPALQPKGEPAVAENSTKLKDEAQGKQKPTTSFASSYKLPKWSAPPAAGQNYKFEVLKSGQIIEEIDELEQKATWTFGRLPDNDVEMAHPTISRFHAVLQYKPKPVEDADTQDNEESKSDQPEGWYVYDLGSTHGTFLNKQRLPPHVFMRMRVGHMLKLGASTRAYILQGPAEDEEPESELTVTELREQYSQKVAAAAAEKQRQILEAEERERNEGVSWGMGEDADEETDLTHNPYATTNNEDLFFDDPKRTLRGYFEREGLDLEYRCDEMTQGTFVCRVELPLDDSNGRPIIVEVVHKGRKKDCVVQCALESCRTLDRHGVLRQANQESQKRKQLKSGDSDDDDEFWDRTGDVARKKQRKSTPNTSVTVTYDDLIQQESTLNAELQEVEQEICKYQENEKRLKALTEKQQNACDDLDNFMDTLSEGVSHVDKTEIKKLRLKEQRIKFEQLKLQRLIKLAKPTALPFVTETMEATNKTQSVLSNKKQLPMIGKRNQFSKFKVVKPLPSTCAKPETKAFASDEEEVEESEEVERTEVEAEEIAEAPAKVKELNKNESTLEKETINDNDSGSTKVKNLQTSEVIEQSENVADTSDLVETDNTEPSEEELAQKKRRQRVRQRNKQRHEDEDELTQHEDSDKYAKWVPPTNQSGDGITHLNEKFGY